jgi:hypothetical protein
MARDIGESENVIPQLSAVRQVSAHIYVGLTDV